MPAKKRFFTRAKKKIGKRSVKDREKETTGAVMQAPIEEVQPEKEPEKKAEVLKEEKTEKKSPSNSRYITETLHFFPFAFTKKIKGKQVFLGVFFLLVVGLSIWQGIVLVQQGFALGNVLSTRSQLRDDMGLWQNIANQYPTYRDAYFQAALIAYRLGDKIAEKQYVAKVLELDPNYQPAKKLESLQ